MTRARNTVRIRTNFLYLILSVGPFYVELGVGSAIVLIFYSFFVLIRGLKILFLHFFGLLKNNDVDAGKKMMKFVQECLSLSSDRFFS